MWKRQLTEDKTPYGVDKESDTIQVNLVDQPENLMTLMMPAISC
jgi:hypothetical protein